MAGNRERLIEAAADLFHRQGYRSTTLDDVLDATGVSRSNLYYHFDSKQDLAVEVVRHWTRVYDAELVGPALAAGRGSPARRLQSLYERAADFQDPASGRTGCPLGRLATDLAAGEPRVQALLDDYFAGVRTRICALLEEADGAGLPPDRALRLADLAVCVLEGSLLLSALRSDPDQVRNAGRTFVRMLDLRPAA